MKLVLVQPPIQDFYDTKVRLQPLGLAYLKSAVKKFLPEVEVVVKDFHQGRGRRTIPLPPALAFLKAYYPYTDLSPFSLFHHYYHFGASFETLAQEVAEERPDLVGISSLFTPYFKEVLWSAEAIKKTLSVPIVLGGAHVSANPEFMLQNPAVDWVIRGEGERPLVELIKALQSGRGINQVSNLGYKQGERMILNPLSDPFPIDDLPLPDFSDFTLENYQYEKQPLSFLTTSRGCPHHCAFCSVHQTFPIYRQRTTEDVFREISFRYQEGYRVFDFEDDNLTFNQAAIKALCQKMIRTFPPGEIKLLAMNGISHQSLGPELLGLMRKAGFTHLNLSLVSANPKIRRDTGRTQEMRSYLQTIQEAFPLGFKMVVYQILGLPGESFDSMIRTLLLNPRLPVLLGASPFYRTPGTALANKLPKQTEKEMVRSRLTALGAETVGCGRDDLYTLFITTRIINFLKGLRFNEKSIDLTRALEVARSQGKRSVLGVEILERLWVEGRLYAATRQGFKSLSKFKTPLFLDFWSRLEMIRTQEGKIIKVKQ